MKATIGKTSIRTRRAIALLEHRTGRARRNGLPPIPDYLPEDVTAPHSPRLELIRAGLHAPWGEPPALVVEYGYASCPEDVETGTVRAEELDIPDSLWTPGFILGHAGDLAREWIGRRGRGMALAMAARTAREINEGACRGAEAAEGRAA